MTWTIIDDERAHRLGLGTLAVVTVVVVGALTGWQPYYGTVIPAAAAYALAATGLDIIVGWLGEVSVGQAAAMAVGAYSGAPLLSSHPILAVLLAAAAGFAAGVVIGLPAVRVRGFALATYTLVFTLLVQEILTRENALGGGSAGEALVPGKIFGLSLQVGNLSMISVALMIVGLFGYALLKNSLVGTAWRGVGMNEQAATSVAVDPTKARLAGFGMAGLYGGVAGLILIATTAYVSPDIFSFTLSINLLVMIVVGGRSCVMGGVIGAAFFTVFDNYAPSTSLSGAYLGLILVVVVWRFPRGAGPYIAEAWTFARRRVRRQASTFVARRWPRMARLPSGIGSRPLDSALRSEPAEGQRSTA